MSDAKGRPTIAPTACILDDGRGTLANVLDREEMIKENFCYRTGIINGEWRLTLH